MRIEFTVPAIPVAQPRQRHRVMQVAGRTITQNFTPAKAPVNAYKAAVQLAASQAYQGPPLQCPLRLDCLFVLPRPKALMFKKREMPRVPHTTARGDLDNFWKSTVDALAGTMFGNDCQVYASTMEKWIASGSEQPHVVVTVQWDD